MNRLLTALGVLIGLVGCASAPRDPHPLTLDHVFSFAQSQESRVIEALTDAGFTVDPKPNRFPDGLYGRYVVFPDSYFEILWLDPQNTAGDGTKAQAAWTETGASPFGVAFRLTSGGDGELPFPSTAETSDWLIPGAKMRVLGDPDNPSQPGLFVVPAYMAANGPEMMEWRKQNPAEAAALFSHPNNAAGIASVTVTLPANAQVSPNLRLAETGVALVSGAPPLMTVRLKGEGGRSLDLRPDVPMIIEY